MIFSRKKLLNRLLLITLCTTFIPLVFVGIYFIPKTGSEIKKASREKLVSHSLILSNYFQKQFLFPIQNFIFDLASIDNLSDNQFNDVLNKHSQIQPFLNSVTEIYSDDFTKVWYSSSIEKIEPTFRPDNYIIPDSTFVIESNFFETPDSTMFMWIALKNNFNSVYYLIVDLSSFFNSFKKYALVQNIESNFGIIDFKNDNVLFSSPKDFIPTKYHVIKHKVLPNQYEYQNDDLREIFGAYLEIDSFADFRIVAELSRKEIDNHIRNLWIRFGLLVILGFLLAFLGTIYYWRKITNPLDRFARSATEIARGNFDQKIQLESEDEIGKLAKIFNYMVVELRRLNNMNLNRIITERTKTKTIIKNIGDGIFVTDENDRIVTVNVAIEKWFSINEKDVVDKPIESVISEPTILRLIEEIKETDLEGTFTRDLPIVLNESSKEIIFQARATKIISREKKFMGVVTILRDITREKEIDRMKTELVSMVAHELRSPLTSISGFSELMQSNDETYETIQEYAKVIHEESIRLTDLVNKFLDITKIESGKMDYNPMKIKVKDIFDNILFISSTEAQKKSIEFSVHLQNENIEIYADNKMMSEVILNLLSNAVKYSSENTKIELSVEENTNFTKISVTDQGFGISPEHIKNIFKKFYRIKNVPRVQEERGTGLGLSLVKEIVELHRGSITVNSQIDKGTNFTVNLPRKQMSTGWKP